MSFTRYASYEVSEILDVKGSKSQEKTASLNKIADFDDYRTEDGYLYARIRAISSRVNKNNDGWPSIELAGSRSIFDRHQASTGFTIEASDDSIPKDSKGRPKYGFATFTGKPIFVDHNNSDPKKSRGVIVDAKLHVEDHKTAAEHDSYYKNAPDNHTPPTWVELLLEIDAKSYPKFAQAILEGSRDPKKGIDGFSMGCDVEHTICNICEKKASSPREFCEHVKLKGAQFKHPKTSKMVKSYEDCYGIKFFEISGVFDPADETALVREVRSAVHKEAEAPLVRGMKCPQCSGQGYEQTANGYAPCLNCEGTGEIRVGEGSDGAFILDNDQSNLGKDYYGVGGGPKVETPAGNPEVAIAPHLTVHPNDLPRKLGPIRHGSYLQAKHAGEEISPAYKGLDALSLPDTVKTLEGRMTIAEENARKALAQGDMETADVWARQYHVIADELKGKTNVEWRPESNVKIADNPVPQSELTKAPEKVDTLREDKICPICGSNFDGHTCEVCNYVEPPEGLNNPDLDKAQEVDELEPDQSGETVLSEEPKGVPTDAPDHGAQSYLQTRNTPTTSGVRSDMTWKASGNVFTAGKINQVERPILAGNPPVSNEPSETVLHDPEKPIIERTASDLIAAANQKETTVTDTRVAAEPADPSGKAQKQVDVEGVGGVIDATNEQASKPSGNHSYENAGTTTDVTGKGGVIEDSNAEASKPSDGTESVEKSVHTPGSGPTKTWDNSNEPNSAVSDKAFPTASVEAAKQGVKPIAEEFGKRVDVEQEGPTPDPIKGTQQWTGTDGNGVTKQAPPVTNKGTQSGGITSHTVAVFKLADVEVDLGLTNASEKWARIGELEGESEDALNARLATLERVKTAGLAKREPTIQRLPSLRSSSTETVAPVVIPNEALFM